MTNDASAPRTVLIIEDSQVQSKIIAKQITAFSQFTILQAYSLVEAQDTLSTMADSIFAAVVDLNLPDAPDGEAVDLCLDYDVPAIVLTATFNDVIRQSFIKKRVADFFFKGAIEDIEPLVWSLERLYKNQSLKVLVVDDSKTERGYMRTLLETQRFSVVEAADGQEALEVLDAHPDVRLIVTDYEMPNMDGLEFVREVRHTHGLHELGIIGVSGVHMPTLSVLFLKHGVNDFLRKPFEVEDFVNRVNKTMNMLDLLHELSICYEQVNAAPRGS